MDIKLTIDIILKDLKEARSLIDDLKNKPELSLLNIELAKSKCHSAENVIKLLGKILESSTVSKSDDITTNTIIKDIVVETETKAIVAEEVIETEKVVLADKFTHLSNRMNEKIRADKKANGQSEALRTIPVKDLTKAIGINDRYFYIRELFKGEEGKYKSTIEKLNMAVSVNEATGMLKEVVGDLTKSDPALQLIELVERKLSHLNND